MYRPGGMQVDRYLERKRSGVAGSLSIRINGVPSLSTKTAVDDPLAHDGQTWQALSDCARKAKEYRQGAIGCCYEASATPSDCLNFFWDVCEHRIPRLDSPALLALSQSVEPGDEITSTAPRFTSGMVQ